jgi:hypothetical protein
MMNYRLLLYFGLLFFGVLIKTLIWNRVTRQVNQQLPENEQYSLSMWSLRKSNVGEFNQFRIWRTHRRLFPDSYLRLSYATTLILTLLWFFSAIRFVNQ